MPAVTAIPDPPGPTRADSTSQSLLVTLLGDYWFGRPVHIPSSALVDLLGEFGVGEQAARAALSRVSRTGHLEGAKQGRRTAYRLSPESAEQAVVYGRAIMRFTAATPEGASSEPWDGCWTVVAYAGEAHTPDDRRRIRIRLRELGFVPLQDALWVSPFRGGDEAGEGLRQLGVGGFTVLEGATSSAVSTRDPRSALRLDDLAARYHTILEELAPVVAAMRSGALGPREALVARTRAMSTWRLMAFYDPGLPVELLPDDWPGWEARTAFAEVYDGLGAPAAARVREVVAPHSEEAAAAVHHDTVVSPRGDRADPVEGRG